MSLKAGDLIWQCRLPGGFCIYLREELVKEVLWSQNGEDDPELYYEVFHPIEGLVFEPSYYYESIQSALESASKYDKRR